MIVARRMTPNPITATPDMTHPQALDLMRKNNIRHLPVLENGKLVGIVAENDLLSSRPSPATTLSIYEIYSLLDNLKLRQIMSSPVYAVEEDCPLEEAARILTEKKITALPVMRGEELVGIITEIDLFRALVDVLGGDDKGLAITVRLEHKPGALATVAAAIAKAGGNILNIVVFRNPNDQSADVYIKEIGADQAQLEQYIRDEAAAELLDVRPSRHYEVLVFGKPRK
ncbi:MAG: CBS and ACT domain-containing protein [Anaerolineae bacterium]